MASRRRILAALTAILFIVGMLPALAVAAAPAPSKAATLNVTANPPRLPADGKTYSSVTVGLQDSSGNPSLALAPLTVYLASSETAVATVPPTAVIQAGRGFVTINVTTTQNAGVTTLTASASGLTSSSAVVTTMAPSGFATRLAVTPNPSSILEGSPGSLVVQLEDATGAVARASSSVVVTITSADNQSATITTGKVTIPAGSETGVANYTAGYVAGAVTVTASSPGFQAATAEVTISASSPVGLVVNAQPNEVVEGGTGRTVVWLSNSLGFPAIAAQPIVVSLTSSNLGVVRLFDTSVTIPQGQFSAIVNYSAGTTEGFAAITASAQGLSSGFSNVETFPAALQATTLQLFISPDPTLADGGLFQSVLVGITNASGFPTTAPGNVKVNLTSSSTFVGSVTNTITIAAGTEFGTALFASQFLVGTTVITASAQGLNSAQAEAATYGPVPVGLSLTLAAPAVPANGVKSQDLAIGLVDVNGHPAVAPANIQLELTSSKPNVASVQSSLTIPAGQSYALATVTAGISPGLTLITVTAPGYGSSSSQLTTTAPAPSKLAIFATPQNTLNSTIARDGAVLVQLQDANGYPADAVQSTTVTVTSSNSTVLKGPLTLTFSPGSDLAWTPIFTSSSGFTNLTASAAGLSSSSAKITVLLSPEVLTLTTPEPFIYNNETAVVTLTFTALGTGVANATIVWHTNLGTLSLHNSTTSAAGTATNVLSSTATGAATVIGTVSSPLIGVVNVTTVFSVIQAPAKPSVSILSGLGHVLIYLVLVVIVVLLVVAFLFVRRRRAKRRAALGEEVATEDLGTGEGSPFTEGTDEDLAPQGPG